MVKELIMGFDCREMWRQEAEVKNWENKRQLLNSNVERVLSINRMRWQSVFHSSSGKNSASLDVETAPGYNLTIPVEWMTPNRFWRSLEAMREFLIDHKEEDWRRCWMIGITIVQTPEYLLGTDDDPIRVPLSEEIEPDQQWTLLGYDVEDSVFFNRGLGTSWTEEYETERRKLWGTRLNQYHLFSRQEDALEYASWHTAVDPGLDTLLVFGLYLIQEIP